MAWRPDYVDVNDLAAYVRIEDDMDDAQLEYAVTSASRAVDRACGRQFGRDESEVERYYTSVRDPDGGWVVQIDDLMSSEDIEVSIDPNGSDEHVEVSSGWRLAPRNAQAGGDPYTRLVLRSGVSPRPSGAEGDVRIRARFGWDEVPSTVEQATLLQASRFLFRRDSPAGIAGSPDNDSGSEVRLLAKADPDVRVMLGEYKRWPRGFA